MIRETIQFERRTGTRTVLGTDWPIRDQVVQRGRKYIAVVGLCNGVPADAREFASFSDALAYLVGESDSQEPRP